VTGIDIEVRAGSFVALLGSNGAGKSTTLRSIAGLHRPIDGSIRLDDREISRFKLYQVVRQGLALVLARVYDLFPRLKERRRQTAGLMSGGEQQMLAIGRALMTAPQMLVLDEPSMGLAPSVVDIVFDAIAALHAQGQSILMVEQNAALALSLCDYAYVMKRGQIVMQGPAADLARDPTMIDAYLS